MADLNEAERKWLKYIGLYPDSSVEAASSSLLEGLIKKGLIERVSIVRLPPLPTGHGYRLTEAGRKVVAHHRSK